MGLINWHCFQNALELKIQSHQPQEGVDRVIGVGAMEVGAMEAGAMEVGTIEGEEDLMAKAEVMVV